MNYSVIKMLNKDLWHIGRTSSHTCKLVAEEDGFLYDAFIAAPLASEHSSAQFRAALPVDPHPLPKAPLRSLKN